MEKRAEGKIIFSRRHSRRITDAKAVGMDYASILLIFEVDGLKQEHEGAGDIPLRSQVRERPLKSQI